MPIKRAVDSKGSYYQYGTTGTKYYYKPGKKDSRENAYNRALLQLRA